MKVEEGPLEKKKVTRNRGRAQIMGGKKEWVMRGEYDQSTIYTCMKLL
jgi:hypothetical protein